MDKGRECEFGADVCLTLDDRPSASQGNSQCSTHDIWDVAVLNGRQPMYPERWPSEYRYVHAVTEFRMSNSLAHTIAYEDAKHYSIDRCA